MPIEALPVLADLRERMVATQERLIAQVDETNTPLAAVRVAGKAAGVQLALSYVDEAIRQLGPR